MSCIPVVKRKPITAKTSFILPFYKEVGDEGRSNFTPYQVHCLRTKIIPYLKLEFPQVKGIGVEFTQSYIDNKLSEILTLVNGYQIIDRTELSLEKRTRITDQIGNCLTIYPLYSVILNPISITHLPYDWVIVMAYLLLDVLDPVYEPIWLDNMLLVRLDTTIGRTYVEEDRYLSKFIQDKLNDWWSQGMIVNAGYIEESWNLNSMKIGFFNLWYPRWQDNRITECPVLFLRNRLSKPNSFIYLDIKTDNLVIRHELALNLSLSNSKSPTNNALQIRYKHTCIGVRSKSYKELSRLLFLIDETLYRCKTVTSSCFILQFDRIDILNEFEKILTEQMKFDIVTYFVTDINKYVVSVLVPLNTNLEKLERRVYELMSNKL